MSWSLTQTPAESRHGICSAAGSDASIRSATEVDLDRILDIERLSFEKQWDTVNFEAALKDIFLVFGEREIQGFLIACCYEVGNRAIIMKIAVHPDHRSKGIATRLIATVLDQLRKMNIGEVELSVDIVKTGAVKLYEKFGFRIVKIDTPDYEEDECFYTMRLMLGRTGDVDPV